jgi:hypothetical protein
MPRAGTWLTKAARKKWESRKRTCRASSRNGGKSGAFVPVQREQERGRSPFSEYSGQPASQKHANTLFSRSRRVIDYRFSHRILFLYGAISADGAFADDKYP